MPASTLPFVFAAALLQAEPPAFDRVIPLVIDAQDAQIPQRGRAERVQYTTQFSGTLHLWPKGHGKLDLFLRVQAPDGKVLAEDDDSGGGRTPYLKLGVEPGRELVIVAALAQGEEASFDLCAIAAPETAATRAASARAVLALTGIERLRAAGDREAASSLAVATLEALHAVPAAAASDLAGARSWEIGSQTWELSLVQATRTAWGHAHHHWSRTLPDAHPNRQAARIGFALALRQSGELQGARELLQKACDVAEQCLPDDDAELQRARQALALVLLDLGELEPARRLFAAALEVLSRTASEEDRDLQDARLNLAATIKNLGDLEYARALEEKVLEVRARTLPEEHPDLQMARGNLAGTLYELGDLHAARALAETVQETFARTLPGDHPTLQTARSNLASMAWRLGDLDAARVLQEAVLEVRSRTLADDHPDLQVARANLALSLKAVGDLPAARALEEKVLEIRSAALAEDHPELQWARNNLAATLYLLGDAGSARALYAQIIGALSRTLANDHRDLQRARAGLALALQALGEFDAARTLQEAVLEASSRTLHDGHPHLQEARLNLALTLLAESTLGVTAGNEERVVQLLEAVARAQMAAAHELSQTASSREAEERCASFALYLDTVISAAFGYGTFGRSPRLESAAFALSEATRNAGLAAATAIRRAAIAPGHAELRARLRAASADLAARAQGGTDTAEFQRARVARESIERELLELLQDIGASGFAGGAFGASSVAAALQPGQVAIAYRRYARSTVRGPSVDTEPAKARAPCFSSVDSLCAFVVRGTETTDQRGLSPLVLVDLGPLTPIETAVETWRDGLGLAAGRGLRAVARAAEHDQTERGATIRRLVLDPLRAVMAGAERVTLVLDDVLHLVPFDALPAQDTGTKLLGEILRIETRTTLGELLDRPLPPSGQNELVGLGGVDYDLAGSDAAPRTTTAAARILRAGVGQHAFSPLPGTRREIHGVTELFARSAGQDAVRTVLSGTEATGRNLVERAPRARWLHLATHGWHASDSLRSSSDPEAADRHTGLGPRLSGTEQIHRMSPMLLCGLALAGANLPENAVGRTPGLMTAEELSTLDLSNCELAVLSACDTNVGKRRAGQGVASLQRAMQMAGTRSAITSLWKVPDEATEKLMLDFYRRLWVEKKPKGQALWEAKMAMREAATERGLPEHPLRDWAAWVLTGEPH